MFMTNGKGNPKLIPYLTLWRIIICAFIGHKMKYSEKDMKALNFDIKDLTHVRNQYDENHNIVVTYAQYCTRCGKPKHYLVRMKS